ncbi:Tn7-like element transposition protein TnsE [Halomonas sp.]|uniref:Tn7-like element transposition protein TnsE n=1 Tax=Halomonas sp. TaxID=1486246 RepID=UPI003F8ED67E
MKFKGIKNDSVVEAIGSFQRRLDSSDWRVCIKFQPKQQKESLAISQLTALARRRVLNAIEERKPAGYEANIKIGDATQWEHRRISDCPIPAVANREDKDQWSFYFEDGGVTYYLPQLELARVLFFHYAYLSRLAMVPGGLNEEFDVQEDEPEGYAKINILPTSSLPIYARESHELRRLLAWILLDKNARNSFESIANYQLKEGEDNGNHRSWKFRFAPPALENVRLTMRGHFDRERRAFFVYEIHGLENLVSSGPEYIEFYDPGFRTPVPGKGVGAENTPLPAEQQLIDDDEDPSTEGKERVFRLPSVSFSFANPAHTTRMGVGSRRSASASSVSEPAEAQDLDQSEVSTDERTIKGQLSAAVFDAVEDQSDDLHHYTHRFEAFAEMVEILEAKGCVLLDSEIRRLPEIAGFSKHLLVNGNPRCLSFRLLSIEKQRFMLLEIDTFDNKTKLSTLLLKQPSIGFDWAKKLSQLEKKLVKSSLVWPRKYLDDKFKNHYDRIPHPKSDSSKNNLLDSNSIQHWADRVYGYLK